MSFQTKLDLSAQSRIPTGQTADWKGSVSIGENFIIGGIKINPRGPFVGSTLLFDSSSQSYKTGKVIGDTGIATSYVNGNLVIGFTGSSTTIGPRLQSINNLTTDGIMVNYGNTVSTVALSGTSDFVITNPSGVLGSPILFDLSNTGVSGGTYGSNTIIPRFQVDNKGRVLGVTGQTVNIVSALSGLTDVSLIQPVADKAILMYDNNVDLWFNGSVAQALGYTPVAEARTLTINGQTYDLTADRTWTIDTQTKLCPNIVTMSGSSTYQASYGDSVYVDTDLIADNCTVLLPTGITYGGLVYVKNLANPSTYTVSVNSFVLQNGEWIVLRRGKFDAWELVISSLTDTPSNGNTDHAITSGGVFNYLNGYIPITGTTPSGKITGDLLVDSSSNIKFGIFESVPQIYFGVGSASNIGMYYGVSNIVRSKVELVNTQVNISGQSKIEMYAGSNYFHLQQSTGTSTLNTAGSFVIDSPVITLTNSSSGSYTNISTKGLFIPNISTSDRVSSNGSIAYNSQTIQFEGQRNGIWRNFLMEGDLTAYTGTPNRITITTGGTIDIASTYTGQTSITTLGTIGTGTWQGTAIADAYIASAAIWNAKLGLSGGTLTGALNEAPIVTVASASNVDIVNIAGNTAYITGTTGIATFTAGTSGMIRKVQFAGILILQGGNNIRLPNLAATITTSAKDVATFIYNATDSIWYCVSYVRGTAIGLTTNRMLYYNGTDIVTSNVQYLSSGTEVRYVDNSVISFNANEYIQGGSSIGLNLKITNGEINLNRNNLSKIRLEGSSIQYQSPDQYFGSYALADQFGRWTSGGLLIGSHGTINSLTQLDLQATNKGLGLNLVSGNLGTTRNGLLWYDTVANSFKGVANSSVVTFGSASDVVTEAWSTNADYTITNTTAKYLVIQQTGTFTAPRTITLSTLPAGSTLVIQGGASITATNVVNITGFVNGISIYNSALTLAYQSLVLYSLGGGFYSTNKPQFTETTTALSSTKYLRSSSGIGLNGVTSFTPSWATGVAEGDLNWHRSSLAILARDGSSNTIPFMPYASFEGWQCYRPGTLTYFNGQNIASGNKPTEYASALGYIYYWNRHYIARCFGESSDNYLEVLFYVNGSGTPSIVRVLQESSVFSLTLTSGTLVFAGGNAYVQIIQLPQQTTTNVRGLYNWVYQQGGTDVRFQGNLALGSSTINSLTQLDLQSTTLGLGLNLVAGNLGTTRNGNIWYDTITASFKGIQSSTVVSFATTTTLSSYVDLTSNGQNITGQKTFSINGGNSQTGTGTGTVITNLDCSNFIRLGRTFLNVVGDSVSLGASSGHGNALYNTIMGSLSGNWSMSGQYNAMFGYANGISLTSGGQNAVFGGGGANSITTGSYNTIMGFGSGYSVTTGSYNVFLGSCSGWGLGNVSYRLAINATNSPSVTFPFIYGEFDNGVLAFNINRLGIGTKTPNSACQVDLASTTLGLGLPLVGFGVLPTASSRMGNMLTSSTGTTSGSTYISNGTNWTKVYTTLTGSTGNVGTVTLTGGTATVNTTVVTANSIIQLTVQGGTLTNVGFQYISARVAGTSFTITSSNASDTSDVGWCIIEP